MEGLLKRLSAAFPRISVSTRHPVHPSHFSKVLEAGEVDFAAGILPASLSDLRHRLLFRDHVVCAARKGHHAVGRTLTVQEFASLEHVAIMPNTVNCFGESVDQALATQGCRRNRRFVTPNYLTAPYLLANSDMVALVPALLLNRFRDHLGLAEVALPVQVPALEIYLSWHDRTHRHAAHTWFRDQVVQSIEPHPHGS